MIMIKIIRMVFNSYVYVSNIIYSNTIMYNVDTILDYIDNHHLHESNNYNDDNKNKNKNKNNKDIEIYNNNYKIFMSSNYYNKDNNNKLNNRLHTTTLKFNECNWCNKNINSTNQITYHYMDNIYCDIKCRNKQIEKDTIDTIKNNQQIRYNYSI